MKVLEIPYNIFEMLKFPICRQSGSGIRGDKENLEKHETVNQTSNRNIFHLTLSENFFCSSSFTNNKFFCNLPIETQLSF